MSDSIVEGAINSLLAGGIPFSNGEVARKARVSRQAVSRYLARMVTDGTLAVVGNGRATRYQATNDVAIVRTSVPISGLAEDRLWEEVRGKVPALSFAEHENAVHIIGYAFTEMVNNAIDHSEASWVDVEIFLKHGSFAFVVQDAGVGIFRNVQDKLHLEDLLAALQEISKGKTTTQPQRHPGEGIFFTSKVADRFEASANGLLWEVDNLREDMCIRESPNIAGTRVRFEVSLAKNATLESTFAKYTHDFVFDTTTTVVKLFAHGVRFVSRSEAKRLLHGLDRFRHVTLDFSNVQGVGQGFADEVFRVWARANPEISLSAENMAAPVAFMVGRARAAP